MLTILNWNNESSIWQKTNISDLLSVGLHVSLLEVGGEPVEVLVVGEEGVGLGAVEVSVPDAQQSQDHGNLKVNEIVTRVKKTRYFGCF